MPKLNIFNTVAMRRPAESRFDLSHDRKFSFNMGELIPTAAFECLPGDKFEISVQNMLRFAPLVSPVMHRIRVRTDYFFVPNRLLWADFPDWIAGNVEVSAPYSNASGINIFDNGTLGDYLGYPTDTPTGTMSYSPMPLAAYALIWDNYYRDQNLQAEIFVPLVAGLNTDYNPGSTLNLVQRRAWMHDYFTACLPFAQKGDEVSVPLVTQADLPVELTNSAAPGVMVDIATGVGSAPGDLEVISGGTTSVNTGGVNPDVVYDPAGSLTVDIQADAVSINTLRRAFKLQEWLEIGARVGTRINEFIMGHFGVKSPDARLQRPEFIGCSHQNMIISEVLATAETTDADVQVGMMAGHGISVGGGNKFYYTCLEHGWIIGIMSVVPDTAYQQGLPRAFTRFDRFDYAFPTFAHIGEQEVRNQEIYIGSADPEGVFGYLPRYAEYRYLPSTVHGDFKASLSFWHLGRIFDTEPALNEDFIQCNPRRDIFAVTDPDVDTIYAHVFNRVSAVRKLPRFGIPTI